MSRRTCFNGSDPFNGYEYIDFGLPSGLLWAKCNVGATTEASFGDYFTWGDTANCTSNAITVNWGNYRFNNGSTTISQKNLTKYNNTDKLTTLELSDDAASVNMGGKWRMPTIDEANELISGTTNQYFSNYNGSGVAGRLFIGLGGYTNVSMFLPTCGYRQDNAVYSYGSGMYGTSSIGIRYGNPSWLDESQISFTSTTAPRTSVPSSRYYGYVIRAVIMP